MAWTSNGNVNGRPRRNYDTARGKGEKIPERRDGEPNAVPEAEIAEIAALDARLVEKRHALASLDRVLGDLVGRRPSISGSSKRPEEEGPPGAEEGFVKDWASERGG